MTIRLSLPSKTFLVGEYAVLGQAPALVLNTQPCFELVARRGETGFKGVPEGSPAMLWYEQRKPLLENWSLEFFDPHQRAGGFGASSAQFTSIHTLTTFLQSSMSKIVEGLQLEPLWNDYQVLTKSRGSGADVLAQTQGGIAYVDVRTASARRLDWPYPEIAFGIVRTHQKIKTHDHLAQIDRNQMTLLSRPASECIGAFGKSTSEVFLSRLKTFATALKEFGLQAPAALTLIRLFEEQPWCLLAKGCGALGADTVLFFYPSGEREKALTFIKKQSLNLVATQSDLSDGLEFSMDLGSLEK